MANGGVDNSHECLGHLSAMYSLMLPEVTPWFALPLGTVLYCRFSTVMLGLRLSPWSKWPQPSTRLKLKKVETFALALTANFSFAESSSVEDFSKMKAVFLMSNSLADESKDHQASNQCRSDESLRKMSMAKRPTKPKTTSSFKRKTKCPEI